MKNKHTAGTWEAVVDHSREAGSYPRTYIECNGMAIAKCYDKRWTIGSKEAEANAQIIAAAPELLQMVYDLKQCIKRLTQDNLSQYDRDTEAQWEGEAHELLTRINPDYYNNANA